MLFLHQFVPGDHKSGLRTSRSLLVLRMYVESICARAGLTIIYGMFIIIFSIFSRTSSTRQYQIFSARPTRYM